MNRVSFLDDDGNPINFELTQNLTFRQLASLLPHQHPFEFFLLLDMKENKLVGKYTKLQNNRQYKLLLSQQLFSRCQKAENLTQTQCEQIGSLQQQINKLQIQLKNANDNLEKHSLLVQKLKLKCEENDNLVESQTQKIEEQIKKNGENYKELKEIKTKLYSTQNLYESALKKIELLDQEWRKYYKFEQEVKFCERDKEKYIEKIKKQKEKQTQLKTDFEQKLQAIVKEKNELMKQYYRESGILSHLQQIHESMAQNQNPEESSRLRSQISYLEQQLSSIRISESAYKMKTQELEQIIQQQEAQQEQELQIIQQGFKQKINSLEETNLVLTMEIQKRDLDIEKLKVTKEIILKQISEQDHKMISQNARVSAFENSKLEIVYRNRITRIVECSEKPHITEINFAIEEAYRLMKQNQLENQAESQQEFTVYEPTVKQQLLNEKKVEIFYEKIYEPSDLDFNSEVTLNQIKKVKGKILSKLITPSSNSYDEIYIFQCMEKVSGIQKDQKLALRLVKNNHNVEGSKEAAQQEAMGLLIAQNMLENFYSELGENIQAPRGFKFQKPYVISKKVSFKTYFTNKLLPVENISLKNIAKIISMLDDNESNLFFNSLKQAQFSNQQEQKIGSLNMLYDCTKACSNQQELQKTIQTIIQCSIKQGIEQEFLNFVSLLDDVDEPEFPIDKFYTAYAICPLQNEVFTRYNGGHKHFDVSVDGKFFSAFTYYTIRKSHRQVCVSHIQGVGKTLFDPLVSTYDGLLSKLDQGYNEIKTYESKFNTAKAEDIGEKYLNQVGITREKYKQKQNIG